MDSGLRKNIFIILHMVNLFLLEIYGQFIFIGDTILYLYLVVRVKI